MRFKVVLVTAILGAATLASAQAVPSAKATPSKKQHAQGDVALTYHWLHTNAQPGNCGCFSLNGAGLSASVVAAPQWSAVFDASLEHNGDVADTGDSLTLASMHVGARYTLPSKHGKHIPIPYVQALVGGAHAGGSEAGVSDGKSRFSLRAGGGVDVPLYARFSLRGQVDYNLTAFRNTAAGDQNNILVSTGVVYRW